MLMIATRLLHWSCSGERQTEQCRTINFFFLPFTYLNFDWYDLKVWEKNSTSTARKSTGHFANRRQRATEKISAISGVLLLYKVVCPSGGKVCIWANKLSCKDWSSLIGSTYNCKRSYKRFRASGNFQNVSRWQFWNWCQNSGIMTLHRSSWKEVINQSRMIWDIPLWCRTDTALLNSSRDGAEGSTWRTQIKKINKISYAQVASFSGFWWF